MRILMHLPAVATMEWQSTFGGLKGLTFREASETRSARFQVYLTSAADEEPIEGSITQVLEDAANIVEKRKLGVGIIPTLQKTMEGMLTQPAPEITVDRDALIDEATNIRRRRRDWLVEQIEEGSYAAIELLKEEFGETVRISVEVIGEAA